MGLQDSHHSFIHDLTRVGIVHGTSACDGGLDILWVVTCRGRGFKDHAKVAVCWTELLSKEVATATPPSKPPELTGLILVTCVGGGWESSAILAVGQRPSRGLPNQTRIIGRFKKRSQSIEMLSDIDAGHVERAAVRITTVCAHESCATVRAHAHGARNIWRQGGMQ